MRKRGHFFPEQHSHEEIILFTRRHWIVFVSHITISLLLGALIEFAIYFSYKYFYIFQENSEFAKTVVILMFAVALLIWIAIYIGWVDYYLDVWMVTNERVVEIKQNALFNRQISELDLGMVEDVSAKVVGFWGTFLNYGTIFVQTAGTTEMFEFLRIPEPYEVQKIVLNIQSNIEVTTKKELAEIFKGGPKSLKELKPLMAYKSNGAETVKKSDSSENKP